MEEIDYSTLFRWFVGLVLTSRFGRPRRLRRIETGWTKTAAWCGAAAPRRRARGLDVYLHRHGLRPGARPHPGGRVLV